MMKWVWPYTHFIDEHFTIFKSISPSLTSILPLISLRICTDCNVQSNKSWVYSADNILLQIEQRKTFILKNLVQFFPYNFISWWLNFLNILSLHFQRKEQIKCYCPSIIYGICFEQMLKTSFSVEWISQGLMIWKD